MVVLVKWQSVCPRGGKCRSDRWAQAWRASYHLGACFQFLGAVGEWFSDNEPQVGVRGDS